MASALRCRSGRRATSCKPGIRWARRHGARRSSSNRDTEKKFFDHGQLPSWRNTAVRSLSDSGFYPSIRDLKCLPATPVLDAPGKWRSGTRQHGQRMRNTLSRTRLPRQPAKHPIRMLTRPPPIHRRLRARRAAANCAAWVLPARSRPCRPGKSYSCPYCDQGRPRAFQPATTRWPASFLSPSKPSRMLKQLR